MTGHLGAGARLEPGEDEAEEAETSPTSAKAGQKSPAPKAWPPWKALTLSSAKAPIVTPMLSESCWATLDRLVALVMSRFETSA